MATTIAQPQPHFGRASRPHPLHGSARQHVLDEKLFKSALTRERKRAYRSNQPLGLLLVRLDDPAAKAASPVWNDVVVGLSAATRQTDLLGWVDRRTTVGLIMPEVRTTSTAFARDVAARVRRELGGRLATNTMSRLSVQLRVQEAKSAARNAQLPVDPLLGQDQREERATLYDITKRALDLAGSLGLLIVLSPLLLLIAALVKLTSPGPALFRQVHVGQMLKPFTMLKFRTMRVNASEDIHKKFVTSFIKSGVEAQEAGKNGLFKIKNDPRVTPIGRILRKTSLDELPQLWNVLRGEMSLVGPRPPLPYEVSEYQAWHCRRILEAKPGITGPWQVAGRSRTTFDEMVRLDLRYAKTRSFWTDVKLLLATPGAVIAGKGAC